MFRIPTDASLKLRTTWLRTTTGWVELENRVDWTKLTPRTPQIKEWGDRGVYVFESIPVKAAPAVVSVTSASSNEWDSLWNQVHDSKGKLRVPSMHSVGWLHDVIQTVPFCEFIVTSNIRKDSVVRILETQSGIVINTNLKLPIESVLRSLFVSFKLPRSRAPPLLCRASLAQARVAS